MPSRIACSREEAFVLSEHFARGMFDGSRVETVARISAFSPAAGVRELPSPPEGTSGTLIAATPDGGLFVGVHVQDPRAR